jgi:hypothetical protein
LCGPLRHILVAPDLGEILKSEEIRLENRIRELTLQINGASINEPGKRRRG